MAEGAQSMINLELALGSSAWKWWVPFLLISLARANYTAKVNGDEETDQLFPVKVSECPWATVRQGTGAVGTAPLSAEKLRSFFYHLLRREDCCSPGLSWNPEHSVLPGLCCLHFWLYHTLIILEYPGLPSILISHLLGFSFMSFSGRAAVAMILSKHNWPRESQA